MRYHAFPRPADWPQRMADLRFQYGKWDLDVAGRPTVAQGALVLTRQEHDQVVADAEALAAVTDKARNQLAKDPAGAQALGVDARLAAAISGEPAGPLVTRIDFFQTRTGWQVSEFNDDCPGGYNEAIGLPATLLDLAPAGLGLAGDLPDALVRLAGDGPVGLAYATAYAEDLQVVELLARLLATQGVRSVLASPAHLEVNGAQVRLAGQDVATVFRFFPADWLTALPNWQDWGRLGATEVPLRNPLACAVTQTKAIHAWLWEHAADSDRALVERLLPRTRMLDEDSKADALQRREDVVLKPTSGRMGEGVVMGRECPPEQWRKRVDSAHRSRRSRPYVVQDRFDSVPVETGPGQTAVACLGAYVVDGRFAGYYSRLSTTPVVAYDATNVLTLVEGL
ncbi:MAG: glutathionylspermidine synthase family protein [Candidatus Thermoplasmatota archaeon]